MKLVTRIFGLPVLSTDLDGHADLNIPEFTVARFSGVRTRTKVKGPFGITITKTKGWILTPFDIKSGPLEAKGRVDG